MIGVVLTAGLGKRLLPVTQFVNKNVLLVGKKPMIYFPIFTLVKSGVKDIVVVVGQHFGEQVFKVVSDLKKELRFNVNFVWQEEALGMPDAIAKSKPYVGGDSIIVVGGDNIFGGVYTQTVEGFSGGDVSFLRKVSDPKRFAVAFFDDNDNIIKIEEKPKQYSGDRAICGPHLFDNGVFELIKDLRPSARGELEIVDLHNKYLEMGKIELHEVDDYWADMGTPESLAKVSHDLVSGKITIG